MNKKDFKVPLVKQKRIIKYAVREFEKYRGEMPKTDTIVVIDMTEPSYKKRFYVVSMPDGKVLRQHHVSHGVNTSCKNNRAKACYFSNTVGSLKSSKGAMKTGGVYYGSKGKSLRLHGLEKGVNNNVFRRAIVIHKARYVTDPYILRNGRAGQSFGCPALDPAVSSAVIDEIKGGTFVYIHAE